MKKVVLLGIILSFTIISGCDKSHNFMDVDNPNAKEDLKNFIGTGNIPQTEEIVPDSLSGIRKDAKGYANKIYEENLEEYVDKAKVGLSGATQTLKGFYNDKVDEVNGVIINKVNGAISSELDKIKIK